MLVLAYSMEGCTELVLNMHYMYYYKEIPNNKTEKPLGLHNFWMHQHKWLRQILLDLKRGNVYLLVITDHCSKWAVAYMYAIPNPYCCTEVNRRVFLLLLNSRATACNQGCPFEVRLISEVCKILNIKNTHTIPYHLLGGTSEQNSQQS